MKAKEQINKIEQRTFPIVYTRTSDKDGNLSRNVEGAAAVMGMSYNMGWYREKIEAGAFDKAIAKSDIRALFNHDPNYILARTGSNTLTVSIVGNEFRYAFEAPNTTYGNDLLVSLERGDVKESSFAFIITKERWDEEIIDGEVWDLRCIEEIEIIYDVAPVTYPANPDTSVAKRSFDQYKEADTTSNTIPLSVYERELELY